MFGIKPVTDRSAVAKMASAAQPPAFEPKAGVRIDANEAEAAARADNNSVGEWFLWSVQFDFFPSSLCMLA